MKFYCSIFTTIMLLLGVQSFLMHAQDANAAGRAFSRKEIHEAIFDLYFPEDVQLSTTEKKKRKEWREQLWMYVQTKSEIIGLLDLLQPSSSFLPDDLKASFSDIILNGISHANPERIRQLQYSFRRHPDNNVRKVAARLRILYSYLSYSNQLTSKISGYSSNNQAYEQPQAACVIPQTQLRCANKVITHVDGPIDYLIIGSGPAGSLIAYELLQQNPGSRVVLVDAGSFVKPRSVITESAPELMESNNMRTTTTGGIFLRNGRALGGGTIVNLDLAFSPLLQQIKNQIQRWIDAHQIDASLIHEQGQDWKKLAQAYDYVVQHVGTRAVDPAEINQNNKILFDAIPTATTYCLNARKPLNDHDKNLKISALEAFIMPALSKGLSIIPDVAVKKILFDTINDVPHASGVMLEFQQPLNKPYTISDPNNFNCSSGEVVSLSAHTIIVCAGTLGSAEVLLRSNVRNSNIGKGIIIHPSMGMYGRFDKEIDVLQGLSASVYAPAARVSDGYFFESMSADPAFLAAINTGSGKQILDIVRDVKYIGGFGIMLIDSVHHDNKVFIDPTTNQVQVQYTLGEHDKERFRKALTRGLEILFEQGAYEAHIPTCEAIIAHNDEYIPFIAKNQIKTAIAKLEFIENENFISSAHMQGSNKMGNNPQTSVVSLNFKVWDQYSNQEIDNLYVCDSSIFPTSVGANPMQSIYTFAKLFIDRHIATKNF